MSWIIGKGIQDYEIVLTAVKDKIHLVVIFPGFLAQNTAAFRCTLYVCYSPWRPKMFHETYMVC